ncbi:hypothetical protein AX16_009416 [Volvariella volvacea WC 439]|nr:hypothetical protein AX16_009416 [Volvariella volvacea WC 439]
MLFSLIIPLFITVYASAHGIVDHIIIGDTEKYQGPGIADNTTLSAIRAVQSKGPLNDTSSPFLNCGIGAQPAELMADAMPGNKISFAWRNFEASNGFWIHDTGPILTYLASCGDISCANYSSQNADWFKIWQDGRHSDDGKWIQANLIGGAPANVQLPDNLARGNYLVRHEIIALHLANETRGAEFYVSCSQIRVGGSGTGRPRQSDLVKFPGAYKPTDPGILVNAYDTSKPYVFPGPPIATLVSSESRKRDNDNNRARHHSTSSYNDSAPSSDNDGLGNTNSSGFCAPEYGGTTANTAHYQPRRVSRIMRSLQDLPYGHQ